MKDCGLLYDSPKNKKRGILTTGKIKLNIYHPLVKYLKNKNSSLNCIKVKLENDKI